MERSTEVWKLILTFFFPPILYTDLISFRSVMSYYCLMLCDYAGLSECLQYDSILVSGNKRRR